MDETATMASFQQSRTVHCNKRKYNSDDKVADMEVEKEADNGTEHMDDDEDGRRTRRRGDDSENQVEVSHETQNMDDVRTTVICTYLLSLSILNSSLALRTVFLDITQSIHISFIHTHKHSCILPLYHTYTHSLPLFYAHQNACTTCRRRTTQSQSLQRL